MKIFNLFKKFGMLTVYSIGGLVTVGTVGLGVASVVYDKQIKDYVTSFAGETQSLINGLVTQFDNVVEQVVGVEGQVQSGINQIKTSLDTQIKNLETNKEMLQAQIDKLPSNFNETTFDSIITQIDNIILQLNNFKNQTMGEIENQINNGVEQVDNVINGELVKQVKGIVGQADSILVMMQDRNSVFWQYYGTFSKALLISSTCVLLTLIGGYTLRFVTCKKVDGVWLNKTGHKKEIVNHVKKILKKYPSLHRVIDEY